MRLTNEGIRGMPAYDKDFRQANSPWLWAGTRTLDGTISPWSDAPLGSIYILIVTDTSAAFYTRQGASDATASWVTVPITGTALDLNGLADGLILDADGDTTISADTEDTINFEINGADDFQMTANTFTSLSGSTIKTNTIAETTSGSGVTIDEALIKDGGIVCKDAAVLEVDTINEATTAAGVTVDGVLIKDTTVDLNGTADALILDADGDTTISAPTANQIDIEINNADDFTFTANTFTALSGSTIATNTIAETTAESGVTIDGVKLKDGTLGVTNSAQAGTNEVQSITVDATGGTFTVTYSGQTTAALDWNITAAALQTALAGLSSVGEGHVVVTGGPGATAPLVCTFQGALGSTDLGAMTTGAGSLTGGAGTATVAEDVKGVAAALTGPLTKKLQIFDATGASLGYVALYDVIT